MDYNISVEVTRFKKTIDAIKKEEPQAIQSAIEAIKSIGHLKEITTQDLSIPQKSPLDSLIQALHTSIVTLQSSTDPKTKNWIKTVSDQMKASYTFERLAQIELQEELFTRTGQEISWESETDLGIAILSAFENGHLETAEKLAKSGDIPTACRNAAVFTAYDKKYWTVFRELLNSDVHQYLASKAAIEEKGDYYCYKAIHRIRPNLIKEKGDKLCEFAGNGDLENLKQLLESEFPFLEDFRLDAFKKALGGGHPECIKILLKESDPLQKDALKIALKNNHVDIVFALLEKLSETDLSLAIQILLENKRSDIVLSLSEIRSLSIENLSKAFQTTLSRSGWIYDADSAIYFLKKIAEKDLSLAVQTALKNNCPGIILTLSETEPVSIEDLSSAAQLTFDKEKRPYDLLKKIAEKDFNTAVQLALKNSDPFLVLMLSSRRSPVSTEDLRLASRIAFEKKDPHCATELLMKIANNGLSLILQMAFEDNHPEIVSYLLKNDRTSLQDLRTIIQGTLDEGKTEFSSALLEIVIKEEQYEAFFRALEERRMDVILTLSETLSIPEIELTDKADKAFENGEYDFGNALLEIIVKKNLSRVLIFDMEHVSIKVLNLASQEAFDQGKLSLAQQLLEELAEKDLNLAIQIALKNHEPSTVLTLSKINPVSIEDLTLATQIAFDKEENDLADELLEKIATINAFTILTFSKTQPISIKILTLAIQTALDKGENNLAKDLLDELAKKDLNLAIQTAFDKRATKLASTLLQTIPRERLNSDSKTSLDLTQGLLDLDETSLSEEQQKMVQEMIQTTLKDFQLSVRLSKLLETMTIPELISEASKACYKREDFFVNAILNTVIKEDPSQIFQSPWNYFTKFSKEVLTSAALVAFNQGNQDLTRRLLKEISPSQLIAESQTANHQAQTLLKKDLASMSKDEQEKIRTLINEVYPYIESYNPLNPMSAYDLKREAEKAFTRGENAFANALLSIVVQINPEYCLYVSSYIKERVSIKVWSLAGQAAFNQNDEDLTIHYLEDLDKEQLSPTAEQFRDQALVLLKDLDSMTENEQKETRKTIQTTLQKLHDEL